MKLIDKMVELKINDIPITVEKGSSVLEAAKKVGINIPTLCHLDLHELGAVNQNANCRVCLVENEDRGN
ncbi:2Fe-2S iron-sulfur cluster-binding protein, partial [Methanocalculus natronophilus]|uniref:2Fe-2S iron-sulfur cluster-binding protein n=1 Tax=Methanocalculus natronophilus TaxID=1262400 RepID=UPI0031B61BC1